ncbi:hypothetical protein AYI68_g7218 [Smittium mucronatum]|uniref:Uncharacterized protein n=1 Tax=Smittium mucronatum TaxID=133383 RepID=A0A1R0GPD1_9FUNG|nr:hypothetical protein AYI68_g7218 [Smittium mucronatum]
MDFDTYVNKEYANGLFKLMSEYEDKPIFYGGITKNHGVVYMQGRFYGVTRSLLQKMCNSIDNVDFSPYEDVWFGKVVDYVRKDIQNSDKKKDVFFMGMDGSKVWHKIFKDKGVYLHLGRGLSKSEK